MLEKDFDYKEFANKMAKQSEELIPSDIKSKNANYLLKTVEAFVIIAGEGLEKEDNNYTKQQAMFLLQVIAEWTFHKVIDLCHSNVPQKYWDAILQKIAYTIYEIYKQCVEKNIEQDELLEIIEHHVRRVYKECLNELYKKNVISDTIYNNALEQPNIDCIDADENLTIYQKLKQNTKEFIQRDFFPIFSKILAGVISILLTIWVINFAFAHNIKYPFLLAIICIIPGYLGYKLKIKQEMKKLENVRQEMQDLNDPNKMYDRLGVDVISLQIGSGLVDIADIDNDGLLFPKIAAMRQRLTDTLGYIVPNIRIMDSTKLDANEYVISIRQNSVATGYVYPNKFMMLLDNLEKQGIKIPDNAIVGVDPTYSASVVWVDEDFAKEHSDIIATAALDVIITHLEETLIKYVDEIFTLTDVLKLLELLSSQYQHIAKVEELVPGLISHMDLRRIFVNLIREKVSIKDISFIFERLLDYARSFQEPDDLSERIRVTLRRQICLKNANTDKILYCCSLSEELESKLTESVIKTEIGTLFNLEQEQIENLVNNILVRFLELTKKHNGEKLVLLCSPNVRLPLFGLLSMHMPDITVLSYAELIPDIKVEKVGKI